MKQHYIETFIIEQNPLALGNSAPFRCNVTIMVDNWPLIEKQDRKDFEYAFEQLLRKHFRLPNAFVTTRTNLNHDLNLEPHE